MLKTKVAEMRGSITSDASDESGGEARIDTFRASRLPRRARGDLGAHVSVRATWAYAAAGVETLPESVPLYSPVDRFATPLVFAMPLAPAKRPVPPVITPGSSYRMLAPAGTAWPA